MGRGLAIVAVSVEMVATECVDENDDDTPRAVGGLDVPLTQDGRPPETDGAGLFGRETQRQRSLTASEGGEIDRHRFPAMRRRDRVG